MRRLPTIAVATAILVLVTAARARADLDNPFPDTTVISPGIKVAYTFGEGGGFTYGAELTVMQRTGPGLSAIVAHGAAINLGWSHGGTFHLRAGWQVVSWFAGVEAGPALIWREGRPHFGVGVTPWLGAIVVPYYTYTWIPGAPSLDEAGLYLKLPLCLACEGGGDDFDFDDDDD